MPVTVEPARASAALRNPEIAALHDVWRGGVCDEDGFTGPKFRQGFYEVLAAARVVEVNSLKTSGPLNYDR